MKIALYARVSTNRQMQSQSIEQQLERLREATARQPEWELTDEHIYRDDGYTGAKLNRPGLDRLRDAASMAAFELILVTAPDRLARKYVHQVLLIEELHNLGCDIQFLERPMKDDDPQRLRGSHQVTALGHFGLDRLEATGQLLQHVPLKGPLGGNDLLDHEHFRRRLAVGRETFDHDSMSAQQFHGLAATCRDQISGRETPGLRRLETIMDLHPLRYEILRRVDAPGRIGRTLLLQNDLFLAA